VVTVGPLSLGALRRLIASRLGAQLPGPNLSRLRDACGGNPYFALEMARAIELQQKVVPGEPFPLPESLHELVRIRIERLPSATRETLLAASSLSQPTVASIERAIPGRPGAAIARALEAGVLELDGSLARFTHPLLRAAAYSSATPERRRRMHRRLAEVVSDPEERARHLALGSKGPDAEVARALEEAARVAHTRGAPEGAAQLAELAGHLTPADQHEEMGSRFLRSGRYYQEAGDPGRSKELLQRAIAVLPKGAARFNALILLASHAMRSEDRGETVGILEQARAQADGDPYLLCDVEQSLVWVTDLSGALLHARTATALAERGRDPVMRAEALSELAFFESMLGRGIRIDMFEQAPILEPDREHPRTLRGSAWILGTLLLWAGDLAGARSILEEALGTAVERGDQDALTDILLPLTQTELRAGDWPKALDRADECWEAATWSGLDVSRMDALQAKALIAAHQGRVQEAARDVMEAARIGIAKGSRLTTLPPPSSASSRCLKRTPRKPIGSFIPWLSPSMRTESGSQH